MTKRVNLKNALLLPHVKALIDEGHTVTINVKGRSMRPFLEHERDKVTLSAAKELHVGDAVLAEDVPDHYVLHRIIEIDGEHLTLMGDGNLCGTEHCLRENVLGIVTQYISPKRTISATDKALCRKIRLWRKLLPIRRYLLWLYRFFYLTQNNKHTAKE